MKVTDLMAKVLSRKLLATLGAIICNTVVLIVLATLAPQLLSPELLMTAIAGNLGLGGYAVTTQGKIDTIDVKLEDD